MGYHAVETQKREIQIFITWIYQRERPFQRCISDFKKKLIPFRTWIHAKVILFLDFLQTILALFCFFNYFFTVISGKWAAVFLNCAFLRSRFVRRQLCKVQSTTCTVVKSNVELVISFWKYFKSKQLFYCCFFILIPRFFLTFENWFEREV